MICFLRAAEVDREGSNYSSIVNVFSMWVEVDQAQEGGCAHSVRFLHLGGGGLLGLPGVS